MRRWTVPDEFTEQTLEQTVVDAIEAPIFVHDGSFRVVFANKAYVAAAGLPIEEILGRVYWEVFPPGDGPLPSCKTVMNEKVPEEMGEDEVRLADGRTFLSRSYFMTRGEVARGVHVLTEITERANLCKAVREGKARFRAMFTHMPSGVMLHESVFDAHGKVTNYRFVDVNPAFERVTGLRRTRVVGRTVREVLPETNEMFLQLYGNVTQGGAASFAYQSEISGKFMEAYAFKYGDELFGTVVQDVSLLRRSMLDLIRERRTLRVVGASNQTLVRTEDEDGLLHAICELAVREAGYSIAWVGLLGRGDDPVLSPVACAGVPPEKMEIFRFDLEREGGCSIPLKALRAGEPITVGDVLSDPSVDPVCRGLAESLGFRSVLCFPLRARSQSLGVLTITASECNAFTVQDVRLLKELADDLAFGMAALRMAKERDRVEREHTHLSSRLEKSFRQSVQAIATALEARDPYTAGHQRVVTRLAVAIAREMGLDEGVVESIAIAGSIHDIGKIGVPAEILNRPGKLTMHEFGIVKDHARIGYEVLKDVDFPWPVAKIVRQHHERLDGSGYPDGLSADEILIEAHVIAVADMVDAITSHRPYRPGLGLDRALAIIAAESGTKLHADAVDACLKVIRRKGFRPDSQSIRQW